MGNRRTTFYAQASSYGDDQPAGTNQGANQLIITAKNKDWQEKNYRRNFVPPHNVAVNEGTYTNVQSAGYNAKDRHDKNSLYGNRSSLAQKFDTCVNGCKTPQWPGEILPGSEPILPIASAPVDDTYNRNGWRYGYN